MSGLAKMTDLLAQNGKYNRITFLPLKFEVYLCQFFSTEIKLQGFVELSSTINCNVF